MFKQGKVIIIIGTIVTIIASFMVPADINNKNNKCTCNTFIWCNSYGVLSAY